jgi:hypothetical protein
MVMEAFMSHVGKGEHDFEGIPTSDPVAARRIKAIRRMAREIIDELEPRHINSYEQLARILKRNLGNVLFASQQRRRVAPQQPKPPRSNILRFFGFRSRPLKS